MAEGQKSNCDVLLPKTEHVAQGGYRVSADPSVVLTTLLGSSMDTPAFARFTLSGSSIIHGCGHLFGLL